MLGAARAEQQRLELPRAVDDPREPPAQTLRKAPMPASRNTGRDRELDDLRDRSLTAGRRRSGSIGVLSARSSRASQLALAISIANGQC